MPEENWREFIQKAHSEYKKIGHIECPAFGGEKIYFNKHRFNHLTRKEGVPRPRHEQVRRINLLVHAPVILQVAERFTEYELRKGDPPAHFWIFESVIDSVKMKVVVRQLGSGRKHFFSIMDRS